MRICDKCKVKHAENSIISRGQWMYNWDVCNDCLKKLSEWVECTNCNKEHGEYVPRNKMRS